MEAKEIAKEIIDLTDTLEGKEELRITWRIINEALRYLSAKDSMAEARAEVLGDE
tara:strand:+ start:215 stop:379 length:165 start_codon:yes stop_codon:yes gene_type:complete